VLPQGLLNNTNAQYIRSFVIEEARILAVVGLHGNTFKPHTGTKTSVLFLQKYTAKEKEEVLNIKTKYEGKWQDFFNKLKNKYKDLTWDKTVSEEELSEELKIFLEIYFQTIEEIEEGRSKEVESEETEGEGEEKKGKKSLKALVDELEELQSVMSEREEEAKKAIDNNKKKDLSKEVRALNSKLKKLQREISERTLAGQISLILNEERITSHFKKFWLDTKVIKEMDYSIFFAVNEKPVKDESGEYRYKKGANGEILIDEHGHPAFDNDLEEIADAFVEFAKKQSLKFWRS
ncbi:MAG: N-6 DNA methylase, partial [Nanoarchaeota archaeon]|nr:N-6 DNA methylase [Nanoarchaeota archaeon]